MYLFKSMILNYTHSILDYDTKIGVLGCMAERLKTQLLEKEQIVDVGKWIRPMY